MPTESDLTIKTARRAGQYLAACGRKNPPKMPGKTWLRDHAGAVLLLCARAEGRKD